MMVNLGDGLVKSFHCNRRIRLINKGGLFPVGADLISVVVMALGVAEWVFLSTSLAIVV